MGTTVTAVAESIPYDNSGTAIQATNLAAAIREVLYSRSIIPINITATIDADLQKIVVGEFKVLGSLVISAGATLGVL